MSLLDWTVLAVTLGGVVSYGLWRSRGCRDLDHYVLAIAFPRVRGRGAFWGVLCGEAGIFGCWYLTNIAFLWYNVIGCGAVVLTGLTITAVAHGGTSELHVRPDSAA
jgi:hypothetical protein